MRSSGACQKKKGQVIAWSRAVRLSPTASNRCVRRLTDELALDETNVSVQP